MRPITLRRVPAIAGPLGEQSCRHGHAQQPAVPDIRLLAVAQGPGQAPVERVPAAGVELPKHGMGGRMGGGAR